MRALHRMRWLLTCAGVLALGGCSFSQARLVDFGRTELARTVSDVIGRWFELLARGSA